MSNPKIYPVIHYIDRATTFSEVGEAIECGADGVFLISHKGNDSELLDVATAVQRKHHGFPIGINLLSTNVVIAAKEVAELGFPMFWSDDVGVDSHGVTVKARQVAACMKLNPGLKVFASVAFKYRPTELHPALAAKNALKEGFIPTTSGSPTGSAPDLEMIIAMSKATDGVLCGGRGMTPWNVAQYAPYLSHILVATGIQIDEHHMDHDKLRLLIANSRTK